MKSNQSIANQICKYMQYIYLILFAGITIRYYLYSTVLEYNYPNALYLGLRYALMAYVLISIAFAVWQKQYVTVLEPVFLGLILGLHGVADHAFVSFSVFGWLLIGILGLVLLIWRSTTLDKPIINLSILKNRKLPGHIIAFFSFQLGSLAMSFILPNYVQLVNHSNTTSAALM